MQVTCISPTSQETVASNTSNKIHQQRSYKGRAKGARPYYKFTLLSQPKRWLQIKSEDWMHRQLQLQSMQLLASCQGPRYNTPGPLLRLPRRSSWRAED